MSTQFYAPDQQATSRQVTSQPPTSQQATSTSWSRLTGYEPAATGDDRRGRSHPGDTTRKRDRMRRIFRT
jgi:hypothetical protein